MPMTPAATVGANIASTLASLSASGTPPDPATAWTQIVTILQTMIKLADISVSTTDTITTTVGATAVGLQTSTAPGSPTGPPAVPIPLAGSGTGSGTGTITG
jgi:hypothetical protein